MLPSYNEVFMESFGTDTEIPSYDYKLKIVSDTDGYVNGMCSNVNELKQSIYFMLRTERYQYVIYPWDYGFHSWDLFGKPISYVIPEVERRIKETLMSDNRITSVDNFRFDKNRENLHVTFDVYCIFGNFESEVDLVV